MSEDGVEADDIPDPEFPPEWQEDAPSTAEESAWTKYDEISEARKANKLSIHKAFKWIIPIAIILAFLGFVILLGVYLANLVLPLRCRWLEPDELQHIHNMVFSSVVGGAVAIFAKTYFLDTPKG